MAPAGALALPDCAKTGARTGSHRWREPALLPIRRETNNARLYTEVMAERRSLVLPAAEESTLLAQQWRWLTRAATFVAILTSPAAFVWFHKQQGWSIGWSIAATIGTIAAFRGFIDIVLRRFIPWPSLFGTDDMRLKEEDV